MALSVLDDLRCYVTNEFCANREPGLSTGSVRYDMIRTNSPICTAVAEHRQTVVYFYDGLT